MGQRVGPHMPSVCRCEVRQFVRVWEDHKNRKIWAYGTFFHAQVVRLALVQLRIDDGKVNKRLRVGEHALDHRPDACAKWHVPNTSANKLLLRPGESAAQSLLTLRTDDLERDLAAVDVRLSLAALHRQHHQKPENTVAMVLWRTKDVARK